MSTWGVPAIAGFAHKAGVKNAHLSTVVALALAATGGKDHYHWSDPMVLGSDLWGLWALSADYITTGVGSVLYDPIISAQAMRRQANIYDGTYEWHHAWGVNGHLAYLPYVEAVLASSSPGDPTGDAEGFYDRLDNIGRMAWSMVGRLRG